MNHAAVLGDCLTVLAQPAHKGRYALGVCDPVYNLGFSYDSGIDDRKPKDEYLAWTEAWLSAVTGALKKDGTLWVFAPEEWASYVDVMARDKFGYTLRRQVVWSFTFGQAAQKNFTKSHCFLLYLTRQKTNFWFDDEAVRVPSARQLVYGDKRANAQGKQPDATWMLLADQMAPYTGGDASVWLQSRVCGTFRDRNVVSPNQVPLPIYDRIVRACSKVGDEVLDPFAGTFGLGEVCANLGRGYTGIELSPACHKLGVERIEAARRRLGLGGRARGKAK